ncbi:MAG: nucleotide sugar dehydrogenase [Thermoguttaceae bacterium]
MSFEKNILCVGAGYVGGPTMAMIADKCPRYRVELVDVNQARIDAWNSRELPIYEPGLEELVFRCRGRNLFFSTDVESAIRRADIIFVSVNTPTKTFGQGAGQASDLQYVERTARKILQCATSDKIVIEKSTLPVRTAEAIQRILHSGGGPVHFDILSNPEFLAEGSAIQDLLQPDRVLIGCDETERGRAALEQLAGVYAHWVSPERIVRTNLWSSELAKLVANAFLAQRVSSINTISALCEATGAHVDEVAHAIGLDSRIGPRFLKASVGFGGSCFKKDILNLVYIARSLGLDEVADYWEQVVLVNQWQQDRFVRQMIAEMFNTLAGKRIAVFGFAFKADTGDTRESPAIRVCRELLEERAELRITDPKALDNAELELGPSEFVNYFADPYQAAEGAHAIALVTDWQAYRDLDYRRIYDSMARPAFVFDGRNLLDHETLHGLGFNVVPLGKPRLVHF